jgi:hypothetical protein
MEVEYVKFSKGCTKIGHASMISLWQRQRQRAKMVEGPRYACPVTLPITSTAIAEESLFNQSVFNSQQRGSTMAFDPFNNKDALAILGKVCKGKSLALLQKPLKTAEKQKWIDSGKLCAECLAIGELIAIGRGNAGKAELPEIAEKWLQSNSPEFDDQLAELAQRVVDQVRSKSVDWNIAYEMGGYPEWTGYCRGLSNRLKKPARARKKSTAPKNPAKVAIKHLSSKLCRIDKKVKDDVIELRCFEKDQITDDDLQHIAQLKKLEVLVLMQQQVTDDGLGQLSALKQLRELIVSGCQVKGNGFRDLKLPRLQRLSVGKQGVNVAIANCQHLTSIREVDFRASDLTDKGLEQLATFKSLEWVWVDNCSKLKGTGFAKLQSLKKLKTVEARKIKFSAAGWKALCGLKALRILEIGESSFPLTAISLLGNLQQLEELQLNDMKLTDKHLEFLSGMRKLKSLKLNRNRALTDATLQHVCQLPALEELGLAGTNLTDKTVEILMSMPKLKEVSLYNSGISRADEKKIERRLRANAKK